MTLPLLCLHSVAGLSIAHPLEPSVYAQATLPTVPGSGLSLSSFRIAAVISWGMSRGSVDLWGFDLINRHPQEPPILA